MSRCSEISFSAPHFFGVCFHPFSRDDGATSGCHTGSDGGVSQNGQKRGLGFWDVARTFAFVSHKLPKNRAQDRGGGGKEGQGRGDASVGWQPSLVAMSISFSLPYTHLGMWPRHNPGSKDCHICPILWYLTRGQLAWGSLKAEKQPNRGNQEF